MNGFAPESLVGKDAPLSFGAYGDQTLSEKSNRPSFWASIGSGRLICDGSFFGRKATWTGS